MSKPFLINVWYSFIKIALKFKFPVGWIAKPAIYNYFVGGESLEECKPVIEKFWNFKVYSLLYYSVESAKNEHNILNNAQELINAIKFTINDPRIEFIDFKPTGLVDSRILTLVSENSMLNSRDQKDFEEFKERIDAICKLAFNGNKSIIIDAEESWYQKAVEDIADEMMAKYNRDRAIVYRSYQMYRTDMLDNLFVSHHNALEGNYILGAKITRGAYMEIERERADKHGYKSPIYEIKPETDRAFNEAVKFALSNIDTISIHCGTHNEDSIVYMISLMESLNIIKNDKRVFFSQLLGMSDNITLNLADAGFNVVKYIPYGPFADVLPYLMRRARENRSMLGQSSRELYYINKEIKRRKTKQKED